METYLQVSWELQYRYSDFLKFYQSLKKVSALSEEDDFYYGLRCMVEYNLKAKQNVLSSSMQMLDTELSL